MPAKKLSLADVAAFATQLPNTTVGLKWNQKTSIVNERGFCWERPLGKADLARLGDVTPPSGDIIAVSVDSLDAKDALLGMELPGFFTIEHFNGYAAVLIELRLARPGDVRAAIETAHGVQAARPAPKEQSAKPKPRKQRAR